MKIALCYSGGMDSRIMARFAAKFMPHAEIVALWWDYGQIAAEGERRYLPDAVTRCAMTWLGQPGIEGYVTRGRGAKVVSHEERVAADALNARKGPMFTPGRNLALAVNTAVYTLADEIWIGGLADEAAEVDSTDKNAEFCEFAGAALSYVLSPYRGNVKVCLPLVEAGFTKRDAVIWALDNGLTPRDLMNTWSCYGPAPTRCGRCSQCEKRHALALEMLGEDDTAYLEVPA